MADKSLVITNLGELDTAIYHLDKGVQNRVLSYACRQAAKPVQEKAKSLVPVRTGELRKSIKVRAMKRSRRFKRMRGVLVTTGEGTFKGETFYGGMIEFGTSKMAAQPFLRPAADQTKDQARFVFRQSIGQGIKREVAKLQKKRLASGGV